MWQFAFETKAYAAIWLPLSYVKFALLAALSCLPFVCTCESLPALDEKQCGALDA